MTEHVPTYMSTVFPRRSRVNYPSDHTLVSFHLTSQSAHTNVVRRVPQINPVAQFANSADSNDLESCTGFSFCVSGCEFSHGCGLSGIESIWERVERKIGFYHKQN